jgi:hypothetical protein
VLVLVIAGGCLALTTWFLYRELYHFTSETPVELSVREVKPGEYEELEKKLDQFHQGPDATSEITLTADDLNLFMAGNPDHSRFAKYTHVDIVQDTVVLEVSIPLDDVHQLAKRILPGRYFNGSVGVNVSLVGGQLVGFVSSATVKGEPVPDTLLAGLKGENIFKRTRFSPKLQEFLSRARSLEVRDGKVIIRA